MKNNKKGMTLEEAKKRNRWGIIPISKLPDGVPVFAVEQYPNKAMAEFHLVEECLVPIFDEDIKTEENATN